MRFLLSEYGKTIMAISAALLCLFLTITFLGPKLGTYYPDSPPKTVAIDISSTAYKQPVLLIEKEIILAKGNHLYDAKTYAGNINSVEYKAAKSAYVALATTYENPADKSSCPTVEVYGINEIDMSKKGYYPLLYTVTNRNNHTFAKTISVLVN